MLLSPLRSQTYRRLFAAQVIALLGTGLFLTLRFGFLQVRKLGHGFAVTSGIYDDPDEPGDVSHFQALTTALSATVGIGNIAGVAIALHWGGPGALFWMWMTALVGMATKYTEVTLAQRYRDVEREDLDPRRWEGTVSGGPMYYIERGLGQNWKWLAVLFATLLGLTAFLTGNGIQANTVADAMETNFGVPLWISGLVTTTIVGAVILGGIRRIGKRIVWALEGDLFLVFHLMITGRMRWKERDVDVPRKVGLAAFDFPHGAILLTEAGTPKRAPSAQRRLSAATARPTPPPMQ